MLEKYINRYLKSNTSGLWIANPIIYHIYIYDHISHIRFIWILLKTKMAIFYCCTHKTWTLYGHFKIKLIFLLFCYLLTSTEIHISFSVRTLAPTNFEIRIWCNARVYDWTKDCIIDRSPSISWIKLTSKDSLVRSPRSSLRPQLLLFLFCFYLAETGWRSISLVKGKIELYRYASLERLVLRAFFLCLCSCMLHLNIVTWWSFLKISVLWFCLCSLS